MYEFQRHFFVEYPIYVAVSREYTHVIVECCAAFFGATLILYTNVRAIRIVVFNIIQYALVFLFQKVFKSSRTQLYGPLYVVIGLLFIPTLREHADVLAWAWVNALILGRWACFLTGVQDGAPGDEVWWGLDQGDGKYRIPSALFESLFMCAMGLVIGKTRRVNGVYCAIAYCIFRIINDAFRPHVNINYAYYSATIVLYIFYAIIASRDKSNKVCHES